MNGFSSTPLAEDVARLYVRCCDERELEVAEMLLRALEHWHTAMTMTPCSSRASDLISYGS